MCVCLCFQLLSHWGRATITCEKEGREGGREEREGRRKEARRKGRMEGGKKRKKKKRKGNQQDTRTMRYFG